MGIFCLIVLAGLAYGLAFVWPSYCFWAVIPAIGLLVYAAELYGMGFWRGFLWGVLVWGAHSTLVFWSLSPLIGSWWAIVLGWLAIVAYLSLFAGLCGLALGLVKRHVPDSFPSAEPVEASGRAVAELVPVFALRFAGYTAVFALYFWWMGSAVFVPFDYWEGYLLLDPLTPWGAVTSIFFRAPFIWVSWLGWAGARLLLITYATCWAWVLARLVFFDPSILRQAQDELSSGQAELRTSGVGHERGKLISKLALGMFLLTGVLLAPGWLVRDDIAPSWVPLVGVAHAGFERGRQVHEPTHTTNLSRAIEQLVAKNPALRVIITPESTYPLCCLEYPDACAQLCAASAGRLLVLASNRFAEADGVCGFDTTHVCNTSFAFQPHDVLTWYDKIHRMFYAERIPSFLNALGLHDVLVSWIGYEFTPGTCRHPVFPVSSTLSLRPCLCSELFFTDCLTHDPDQALPVAAQVNDAWYPGTPVPELLWAVARLKACAYHRVIIYCAYTRAHVLLPHGSLAPIPLVSFDFTQDERLQKMYAGSRV